jgi:SAM-dependent methyltransferase
MLIMGRTSPLVVIQYHTAIPATPVSIPPLSPPVSVEESGPPSRFPVHVLADPSDSKSLINQGASSNQVVLPSWSCPNMIKMKLQQNVPIVFECPYCHRPFDVRQVAQQHCLHDHLQEVKKEGGNRMCQIDDAQFSTWQDFYKVRAKQCTTDNVPSAGTPWGSYKLHHFTELMHNVAHQLAIRNGSTVFEAGFGCGQLLTRLMFSHDVLISGIDITFEVVQVAMTNIEKILQARYGTPIISLIDSSRSVYGSESSRHRLCRGDIKDMTYVPSNSYDHSITFGVLFYLPTTSLLCTAAQELVRIVKPGGSVWFGCHQNFPDYDLPPLSHDFWRQCILSKFPQIQRIWFMRMRELITSDLYDPDRRYSVFVVK